MVNWAIRVLIAAFVGLAVFASVHQLFRQNLWVSISVAAFTAAAAMVDGLKKVLETLKLRLEISKLRREEKERESLVQKPSADEIREYGQSSVERTLRQRYRKTGQYHLDPTGFVADIQERKTR